MRTVIFMCALSLTEIAEAIRGEGGSKNGIGVLAFIFVVCLMMDVVEFIQGFGRV